MLSNVFQNLDLDLADYYEQDSRDRDAHGESLGLRLKYLSVSGSYRDTPNYDRPMQIGQAKDINIMTSSLWRWSDTSKDFKADGILKIRTRDGFTQWASIVGLRRRRVILTRMQVYLVTTEEPAISPYSPTPDMFASTQLYSGQTVIAVANTPVPLSVQGVPLNKGVTLKALSTNSQPISIIGVANLSSKQGLILNPGEAPSDAILVDDLSYVYVTGAHVGDGVSWTAN